MSNDIFPHKDAPVGGGFVDMPPHLASQIPQKPSKRGGGQIGIFKPNLKNLKLPFYQNYCIGSNKILHNDKDHQMLFEGGPNTCITNPR